MQVSHDPLHVTFWQLGSRNQERCWHWLFLWVWIIKSFILPAFHQHLWNCSRLKCRTIKHLIPHSSWQFFLNHSLNRYSQLFKFEGFYFKQIPIFVFSWQMEIFGDIGLLIPHDNKWWELSDSCLLGGHASQLSPDPSCFTDFIFLSWLLWVFDFVTSAQGNKVPSNVFISARNWIWALKRWLWWQCVNEL